MYVKLHSSLEFWISKTPFPIFSKYIVWDNKAMSSVGLIPRGCELHKKIDNYYKNIKFDV